MNFTNHIYLSIIYHIYLCIIYLIFPLLSLFYIHIRVMQLVVAFQALKRMLRKTS